MHLAGKTDIETDQPQNKLKKKNPKLVYAAGRPCHLTRSNREEAQVDTP